MIFRSLVFLAFIGIRIFLYAAEESSMIKLNPPDFNKEYNLRYLIEQRYSCRNFQNKKLKLDDLASILWASGGLKLDSVTGASRTIPSAGATYPLELYVVVGDNGVINLKAGVYHYIIDNHALEQIASGDKRNDLSAACLGQSFINSAPLSLVISAQPKRTTGKYGTRGERYVYIEAGHACQNTYLTAVSLGLATVEVGAFDDEKIKNILALDNGYLVLSVMPIGYSDKWGR